MRSPPPTPRSDHTSRLGEGAMVISACAYGMAVTVSVAALERVTPADLVAVELVGAAAGLMFVGRLRGGLSTRGWGRNAAFGALMPGLAFVLGDSGLSRTSATAGSLLLATELPLSVLLAWVFLRERLRGRGRVALLLGLLGSVVVASGGSGDAADAGTSSTVGNLLVAGSVLASAVFVVLTRRFNASDGLNASTWQTAGAAVCTLPFVLFSWERSGSGLSSAGLAGWGLALTVLASTALGSVTFNWGISRVPAVRASQILNLTPLVGLAAAIVFLSESPSPVQYVGGALVLLGVAMLDHAVKDDSRTMRPGPIDRDEPNTASMTTLAPHRTKR